MKKTLLAPIALALLVGIAAPAGAQVAAQVPPPPGVGMAAGILLEVESGKILWAKDSTAVRPPASLTKVMTALVVLEKGRLDETAPITADARNAPGGRTYAEEGWTFTVRDLLWGLLLQSGNDSAIALAHKFSPDGTVGGFVKLMNDKAAALGATDTSFANPHGYDEAGHVSTARDLAIITAAAMSKPLFKEMVASKTREVPWGDGSTHTFFNHNKLLYRYPGAIGVKTGFTSGAGHSLISAAQRDGSTLMTVVLGSPDHYGETTALFDWGYGNLGALKQFPVGSLVKKVKQPAAAPLAKAVSKGLEIVQLDPSTLARSESKDVPVESAPLLVPAIVLALTAGFGAFMVRRRRKASPDSLMRELQVELDSVVPGLSPGLSAELTPEPAGSRS